MIDLSNIRQYTIPPPEGWTAFGNKENFEALPPTHQAQIFFLDETARTYLFSFTGPSANLITGGSWDPFARGNFRTVEECEALAGTDESNAALKKWLHSRGLPFATWVFVLSEDYHEPLLTTWKMVVKYAPLLFFGGDVMVFDSTQNWCLFYFHENRLFFGRDSQYNPAQTDAEMEALNERKKKYPQFRHPYLDED